MAQHHAHFIDDIDFNPIAYAEQFADPDPSKALSPEELLRKARMILSTELGKDPLLRSQIRKIFKEEARVTVEPTERGITKIDDNHPYFVCLVYFDDAQLSDSVIEFQIPTAKTHKRYAEYPSIPAHPRSRERTSGHSVDFCPPGYQDGLRTSPQ